MLYFRNLLNNPTFDYLKLKTVNHDLNSPISGMNRIENFETIPFIKKNELILITGNCLNSPNQLIALLKEIIHNEHVSSFIINTGPYIETISTEVIDLLEQYQIPLLEMPWRVRVADITRDITEMLFKSKKIETDESLFIKNLIQKKDTSSLLTSELQQKLDLQTFDEFSILIFKVNDSYSPQVPSFFDSIKHLITTDAIPYLTYLTGDKLVLLINERFFNKQQFETTILAIRHSLDSAPQLKLAIGKGNKSSISHCHESYHEALLAASINQRKQLKTYIAYKDLTIHKLLLQLDTKSLKEFHLKILGPLIEYDRNNQQDYLSFLKIFIEENGKITIISKRTFLHRNTVQYRIERIGSILSVDLKNLVDLTNISLALCIEDLPNFHSYD